MITANDKPDAVMAASFGMNMVKRNEVADSVGNNPALTTAALKIEKVGSSSNVANVGVVPCTTGAGPAIVSTFLLQEDKTIIAENASNKLILILFVIYFILKVLFFV